MSDRPADDQSTETRLIAMLAAGDERAVGGLYDRHAGTAFALALAILRNHADAEDAVAQGFAQIWRQRDRYDEGRGSLAAWVHTIVRARALDLYRSRSRRDRAVAAAEAEIRVAEARGKGPEAAASHAELRTAVRAAMADLPPEQRQAIELAYYRGMTQSEISSATETPLGTVKTRVRAGMQRLRLSLAAVEVQK